MRACVPLCHHRRHSIPDAHVALQRVVVPLASGNVPIRLCHLWHALTHFDAGTCITRTNTHTHCILLSKHRTLIITAEKPLLEPAGGGGGGVNSRRKLARRLTS